MYLVGSCSVVGLSRCGCRGVKAGVETACLRSCAPTGLCRSSHVIPAWACVLAGVYGCVVAGSLVARGLTSRRDSRRLLVSPGLLSRRDSRRAGTHVACLRSCAPTGLCSSHVIPAGACVLAGIYGCVLLRFLGAFGFDSAPYQPIEHPKCDEDDRTNDALSSMFDDELDDRVHAFCF